MKKWQQPHCKNSAPRRGRARRPAAGSRAPTPTARPALEGQQAPDRRQNTPEGGPRFSCLTRKALGEATAPHRNGGEDSGPQNSSYTAPCSFYLDISPKRPYLNTWKEAQHHSLSGKHKSKPPGTLWCTHSPHAYQKQNKQKTGNSKNRPIPRTKQKTKSTGEDAEKRALYTADVNAKRRSCNGKQYGRSLQKN